MQQAERARKRKRTKKREEGRGSMVGRHISRKKEPPSYYFQSRHATTHTSPETRQEPGGKEEEKEGRRQRKQQKQKEKRRGRNKAYSKRYNFGYHSLVTHYMTSSDICDSLSLSRHLLHTAAAHAASRAELTTGPRSAPSSRPDRCRRSRGAWAGQAWCSSRRTAGTQSRPPRSRGRRGWAPQSRWARP